MNNNIVEIEIKLIELYQKLKDGTITEKENIDLLILCKKLNKLKKERIVMNVLIFVLGILSSMAIIILTSK